jgi:hypothetical protein
MAKFARCERCERYLAKGKRFCKPCAVETAKRWNLDYFDPEPDAPVSEDDPIYAYERANRIKSYIAIVLLAAIGMLAIVAIVSGW